MIKKITSIFNKVGKTLLTVFFVSMIFSVVAMPNVTFADNKPPVNRNLYPCDGPDCDFNDLIALANGISKELFKYAIIFSSILFAYVGYLYLKSVDNPSERSKARKIGENVVIGLAIMMCAWLVIVLFVRTFASEKITNDPSFPVKV